MNLARSLLAFAVALGCRRAPPEPPARFTDVGAPGSAAPDVARPCAPCHRAQYEAWKASQHARAQRPIDTRDAEALRALSPELRDEPLRAVIAVEPLRQYLVARADGRVQVLDPAWDPSQKQWFSIFGAAPPAPHEWSHWTQRGMNWNAWCAACHTTGFVKGYDATSNAYRSSWSAAGVACAQCHGAMPEGHRRSLSSPWRARVTDTCASCHARREELSGAFRAGERIDDHYHLTLADTPGAYHPDGQSADEDFEYASLSMSRMGQRGVTCSDCHDPHSGGLRAPITRDELCLTCHGNGARGAPVIDATHAHHPGASDGARCVNCHMPAATFMLRDRRRDHGFTIPDPTLTRELGVPNACSGCHTDRPVTWAEENVTAWFGEGRHGAVRRRARVVARAMRGDASVLRELASLAMREDNDAWRASLVAMLAPSAERPEAEEVFTSALRDRSPWVRAAAARSISHGTHANELTRLRHDASRVVVVDSAWATRETLRGDREARRALVQWLDVTCDQPAGALRQSELARVEGRDREAAMWLERARRWDPTISDAWGSGR